MKYKDCLAFRGLTLVLVLAASAVSALPTVAQARELWRKTPWSSMPSGSIDFEDASAEDLQRLLINRSISAEKLAESYLTRISLANARGPGLRAVQSIDPTWRQQAQASDVRRATGRTLGPLDGVPILLKDNIDVYGVPTTAGSYVLKDNVAQRDSTLAQALRKAGAVILGKATMVEFAFWDVAWGYSSAGGQPLNPYDTSYTTSGSSAGSAVAAAAGFAPLTIGTDTGGSVITPSMKTSMYGLRPTTGLVSRTGIVPITNFSDTAGVIGHRVTDLAAALTAISGYDPADLATSRIPQASRGIDYLANISASGLRGKRVGVATVTGLSADQEKLWNKLVSTLQALGAVIVPFNMTITSFPFTATHYEFRVGLDNYLSTRTAFHFPIKNVPALAAAYRGNPDLLLKYGAAHLFAAEKISVTADKAAHDVDLSTAREAAVNGLNQAFSSQRLDVLLFPEDAPIFLMAAVAGFPEIALPAGYQDTARKPFGAVMVGKPWQELVLLQAAHDYDRNGFARSSPSEINPTVWRCAGLQRAVAVQQSCLPGEGW